MKTVIYFTVTKDEVADLRRDIATVEYVGAWPEAAPESADVIHLRLIMFSGVVDAQVRERNVIGELTWVSLGTTRGRMFHGLEIYGPTAVAIALRKSVGNRVARNTRSLPDDVVECDLEDGARDKDGKHAELVQASVVSRDRAHVVESRIKELLETALSESHITELSNLLKEARELDVSDVQLAELVSSAKTQIFRLHKTGMLVTITMRLAREVKRWRDAVELISADAEHGLLH